MNSPATDNLPTMPHRLRAFRRRLVPTGEAIDLEDLAKWVDRMQDRYAATGDWLRPCWWRHGFVVEELAALRSSWLGVY